MDRQPSENDMKLMATRQWKAPSHPFVALRGWMFEAGRSGDTPQPGDLEDGRRPYEDIININVAGCHRQPHKALRLVHKRGFKVVTWGNFPAPTSKEAKLVSDGDQTPWQELEKELLKQVGEADRKDRELSLMEAKLKATEEKLAAYEGKKPEPVKVKDGNK